MFSSRFNIIYNTQEWQSNFCFFLGDQVSVICRHNLSGQNLFDHVSVLMKRWAKLYHFVSNLILYFLQFWRSSTLGDQVSVLACQYTHNFFDQVSVLAWLDEPKFFTLFQILSCDFCSSGDPVLLETEAERGWNGCIVEIFSL